MTHNEQDVETFEDIAKYAERWRDKNLNHDSALAETLAEVHGRYAAKLRAALDAMGLREAVSRERLDEIVHGILGDTFSDSLTDRIVTDLHDAIYDLLNKEK